MAPSLTDTLKELQEGMWALCEDINRFKINVPPKQEPSVVTPQNSDQYPSQRIPGISWAEEMHILEPILDNQPDDEARVVEVSPFTRACIMVSFCSMANSVAKQVYPSQGTQHLCSTFRQSLCRFVLKEH